MSGLALIIGDTGQDGRLLSAHLAREGWGVAGLSRGRLRLADGGEAPAVALTDPDAIEALVARLRPQRIFYLAAHHGSSEVREDLGEALARSFAANLTGLANVLRAMAGAPDARLLYAASSHVFGKPEAAPQTEATPFRPDSPYAVSKAAGVETCRLYREAGVFAATAILYNHESSLRRPEFVTQKIATAAAEVSLGLRQAVVVRNLEAATDWGAAEDTVRAMAMILETTAADDFIVATGKTHTVAEFAERAFAHVGLDWRAHVQVEPGGQPPAPAVRLVGDASRLTAATGWGPQIDFDTLVATMVDAALEKAKTT